MNVLMINASPRKKGVTSALLDEAAKTLGAAHRVEVVRIDELTIKPCIGCLKCRPDKPCILPADGAQELAEKIKAADLLVLGVPVYWGGMPGTLKIFFDRNVPLFEYCEAKPINYIPKPMLKGKRAVLIVNSAAPWPYNLLPSQSRGTIRAVKTVLNAGGVKTVGVINVADTFRFEEKKEAAFAKVRRLFGGL